ncbi:M20/M25/M40 family metallo-hydrolase [Siccirubricoccus deserti]
MTAESTEATITAWLATQQEAMLGVLEAMVNTDGGSYDKAGVDAVGEIVKRFMAERGIPVEVVPREKYGDCIKARVAGGTALASGNQQQSIVLMGHRDTVFPKGEPQRRPFKVENGIATGPGVADMKAGLVMNMFVLAAFHHLAAPRPAARPLHRRRGNRQPRRARGDRGDRPRGKGGVQSGAWPAEWRRRHWTQGRRLLDPRHRGQGSPFRRQFEAGISAIGELAAKITAIHALTDLKRGITLNVGLVSGGQSVNTVAPWAQGQIDLRYVEPADRDEVMGKIHAIVERSFVPGTRAKLTIRGEFLPLTQTPAAAKLFEMYKSAAGESGLAITGEFSGGCADSGFTAAVGAPTICAVGPVGGKAHSPEEYLEVASMVPRAQATARAILRLEKVGL